MIFGNFFVAGAFAVYTEDAVSYHFFGGKRQLQRVSVDIDQLIEPKRVPDFLLVAFRKHDES